MQNVFRQSYHWFLFLFIWSYAAAVFTSCSYINRKSIQNLPTTDSQLKIVTGSCMDQTEPSPLLEDMMKLNPDLYLFTGDLVYSAGPDLQSLKVAYDSLSENQIFQKILKQGNVMAVWDDHDYGANDAGEETQYKEKREEIFFQALNVPTDDIRRQRKGLYFDRKLKSREGKLLQIIVLDTRSFRSSLRATKKPKPGQERYMADPNPKKTMLGAEQWAWLTTVLQEPADLRLIVSSIQVLAEGHGFEKWGNFPKEKQKLLGLLKNTGEKNIFFLSGDRHYGALYKVTEGSSNFYELTSSGINKSYENHEKDPLHWGATSNRDNIGIVEVDFSTHRLTFKLIEKNHQVVNSQSVNF